MIECSLRRLLASPVHRRAVLASAALAFCATCGGGPTTTTTTTTTVPVTTTTTPPTTTTVVTTTTVPTTTTIPVVTGSFTVQNQPCVAPSTGPVTCRFVASASGGEAPYRFDWRITAPNGANVRVDNQQQTSPEIGCGFSTGVSSFNVTVVLTITPAAGAAITVNGTQLISRLAGNCGVV